ncbi:DNA-binding protein [Palleronia sediminis]|uniref:DNA-binding protein n=1 Tax=Palleronia sediminis TaxID=2547833 RepID=A0A4R6ALH9_9RHOB|nr:HU family DNA-binding protein [Palleronia sediminis]TDL84104.1 DNA-binding protein [Palleronia sediminis]
MATSSRDTDTTIPQASTDAAPTPEADRDTTDAPAAVAVAELKKKDLIDRVVAASGAKKKDAKPVVEATLAVLGQALSDGEQLNLQPFGKLRIQRRKDMPNGQALTLKLRRSAPSRNVTEALAEPGKDG